jgi:hypothetical protein
MATQIAIQHYVFQHPDKYPNLKGVKFNNADWSHWGTEPIIELAKAIYEKGIVTPYNPGEGGAAAITATPDNNGRFTDDGETLETTIALETNGAFEKGKLTLPEEIRNIVKSGSGSVAVNGKTASLKPYILGSNDSFEGIEIQPGDNEVKIVLDKRAAEAYVPAPEEIKTVRIEIQTTGGSTMNACKGMNLNGSNQDYIFTAPGESQPAEAELNWTRSAKEEIIAAPGAGALKILKYNKKTNQLVSGAIFEIRGVSPSNWDFLVQIQASPGAAIPLPDGGTAATGVGTIELSNIRPGQYQITEITPPPNFD